MGRIWTYKMNLFHRPITQDNIRCLCYRFATLAVAIMTMSPNVPAQISSGGLPYSFVNSVSGSPARIKIPALSLQQIASLESGAGKDEPFQFGYPFDVAYNLDNSGTWSELPDGGRLWRLRIFADEAKSINLIYDNFYLADGARFFIYSSDQKMLLGAFTAKNNKPNGAFATAPIKGGDCVLELSEPAATRGQSSLTISRIIYGYKNVFFDDSYGSSGSCNIDINSAAGADWQTEKRAVALILTGGGARLCSGALVNNTEQDLKQYLLTANHCLDTFGTETYWIVMFNYERSPGSTEDGPTNYTVQGTTLRARGKASDFALLEISEQIPADYNVHFAGWSAESVPATQTVCIHHPSGDVKKISLDNDAPTNDYWDSETPLNSHWAVVWDTGTTEFGSSGAPLFDQNHRIVGQLHGGAASCSNLAGIDNFGKFSYSWNYYPNEDAQLKCWLDPRNTGVLTLDGRDYYSIAYTHTALSATEDMAGPYRVTAAVTSSKPPLGTIWLHYGWNGVIADSIAMQATGAADQYYADIPGGRSDIMVNYYLSATDASGEIVCCPHEAPAQYHAFYVGIDTIPPVISHTAIPDLPLEKWPMPVKATVTDNLGIDTVFCQYYLNNPADLRTFGLTYKSDNCYSGIFPESADILVPGDMFHYRIIAKDRAGTPNITSFPENDYSAFQIVEVDGLVLIVDDNPNSAVKVARRGDTQERLLKSSGTVANQMQRWLTKAGYFAETIDILTADTVDFAPYDLVISSSGANPYPVTDSAYRTKLENWVADATHKLLIEGGEVGYMTLGRTADQFTTFAANILHSSAWNDDQSGDLIQIAEYSSHPVVRIPETLPDTITLSVPEYYDQDSQRPLTPAFALYSNAEHPRDGGIIVYDNNVHPQSAQIIYYAFNFGTLFDSLTARQLLINSVHFLLAEEKPAVGIISGQVSITGQTNNSGVTIYLSGTVKDTLVTDSTGYYSFENLYDGYYALKAVLPGYVCIDSIVSNLLIDQDALDHLNFQFDPITNGIVRGVVTLTDAEDYSGVEVWVVGPNRIDTTSADGAFYFDKIPPGAISLYCYCLGYTTVRIDTTLPNGGELQLNITLLKDLPAPRNFAAVGGTGRVKLSWQKPVAFSESFETGIPADWTIGNYGSNTSGSGWSNSSTYVYDGDLSACCRYGGTEEISNEWLITNRVAITENSYVLKFWHMASYPDDDNLPNYIRVSTGTTDTADFTIVRTFPGEPLSLPGWWTQVAVDLSDYIDQFVYIAFQYQSRYGENWYIDLVTLESDTIVAESEDPNEGKSIATHTILKSTLTAEDTGLPRSPFRSTFRPYELSLEQYRLYRSESDSVIVADDNLLSQIPVSESEYTDSSVVGGQTYYYVIVADYGSDGLSAASPEVTVTPQSVGTLGKTTFLPDHFALAQNFPNPFNPVTTINYQLPQTEMVKLVIYNLYGQKIKTLVSARQTANYYSVLWNGTNDNGQSIATGIYFCRIEAGDFRAVRKILFLK